MTKPEFIDCSRDCQIIREPCLSVLGLSVSMSETESEPQLSEPYLSEPYLSELELSDSMSERTFIAGIVSDYIPATHVSATLIRPPLSESISELHLSQYSGDQYQVVVTVPIS